MLLKTASQFPRVFQPDSLTAETQVYELCLCDVVQQTYQQVDESGTESSWSVGVELGQGQYKEATLYVFKPERLEDTKLQTINLAAQTALVMGKSAPEIGVKEVSPEFMIPGVQMTPIGPDASGAFFYATNKASEFLPKGYAATVMVVFAETPGKPSYIAVARAARSLSVVGAAFRI